MESRKQGGVPAYAVEEMRRKLIDALNDPDAIPQREALQAALDELDAALPPDTREAGLREALDSLRRTLGAEAYARRTGGPGQMTYLDIEHGISVLSNVIAALAATPRPGLDEEWLARAMSVAWPTSFRGYDTESEGAKNLLRQYATIIAREYARQAGTEADRE